MSKSALKKDNNFLSPFPSPLRTGEGGGGRQSSPDSGGCIGPFPGTGRTSRVELRWLRWWSMVPGPDGRNLPGPDTPSGTQTGTSVDCNQRARAVMYSWQESKLETITSINISGWISVKIYPWVCYALDADVKLCTSVLVSLLSQMTTPAVPMAALSPMVLTRSACQGEIIQRRCKRVAAQQDLFFSNLSLCTRYS